MIESKRNQVVKIAKEMLARGLTDGTSGNVSILDEESRLIAITPSGIPYQEMTPDQIPVIDIEGNIIWEQYQPSSEYRMHLAAYRAWSEINAVIHTHSRYSIALACAQRSLPAITVDMAAYCGKEAVLIPYQRPGTDQLASAVEDCVRKKNRATLLANHGTLFVAPDPDLLIDGAEALELAAMAFVRGSIVGSPTPIPDEDIEYLMELVYGERRAV